MGQLIVYIGGARSGKSRLAQQRVGARSPVAYIATATVAAHDGTVDPEMQARIQRHQSDRPAEWITLEEPRDLAKAFKRSAECNADCILLDCLTLWLSNRVLELYPEQWNDAAESTLLKELEDTFSVAKKQPADIVVVTNDLGGGLVPTHPLGRIFRDVHGRANQRLASIADEVQWVLAGLSMRMK